MATTRFIGWAVLSCPLKKTGFISGPSTTAMMPFVKQESTICRATAAFGVLENVTPDRVVQIRIDFHLVAQKISYPIICSIPRIIPLATKLPVAPSSTCFIEVRRLLIFGCFGFSDFISESNF